MILFKTLVFTLIVPGTMTVLIPYLILSFGAPPSPPPGALRFVGLVPIAVGTAAYLWCAWDFATAGKGTPNPLDPPTLLVTRGLYRFVRNPIFLGIGLILLGEALFFGSLRLFFYAILVLSVFHLRVVLFEEPRLKEAFGGKYEEYSRRVPRWIPRFQTGKAA